MQKEEMLRIYKARLNKIVSRGKTEEFPGVRRKLERKIRNLEAEKQPPFYLRKEEGNGSLYMWGYTCRP